MDINNISNDIPQINNTDNSISSLGKILSEQAKKSYKPGESFNEQLKKVINNIEAEAQPDKIKDIERITKEELGKQNTNTYKNLQKIEEFSKTKDFLQKNNFVVGLENILPPNTTLKKLEELRENNKKLLLDKLIGDKGDPVLKQSVMATNTQLFSRWLKRFSNNVIEDDIETKADKSETLESIEEMPSTPSAQGKIENMKLFQLNMNTALNFLRNLKSLSQRYSPEIVIYEEESGYVDTEKTLETLGWQNVFEVKEVLFNELNNTNLNYINTVKKILSQASNEGIELFSGHHPIITADEKYIAMEKLTGDLAVLGSLEEIRKLQLSDNLLTIKNVAH